MDKVIETKSQMIMRIAELSEENSKLMGKLDAYKMSENEANEIIAELKAENERLKEENELIKERSKELYTFSATYENDKLKQALQEIREIADNQKITADYTINKIIDKINEVIGAE